ncbi:heterogeneous nuclear ribonucleoprotein C-like isoform X2 [Branchiostoma lanceolatum]|uniref:heterogeneous nuclear ribonucleoprotein C-like isoform X2 n=1 Tax=Branchiostoma lanceolatum TaxID=7740 RepID=UPI003456138A
MKNLAALVIVLTVALLADVGHGWRRRRGGMKRLEELDQELKEDVKKVEKEAAWELAMEELDNLAEILKGKAESQLQDDAGSFQKKEESGLQLDAEAAEMEETGGGLEEENDGGLEMEETDGGLEEENDGGLEEENDGGLVMEELKELEEELDVLEEDLQKGKRTDVLDDFTSQGNP